jgi:hypothetical protein
MNTMTVAGGGGEAVGDVVVAALRLFGLAARILHIHSWFTAAVVGLAVIAVVGLIVLAHRGSDSTL